MSPLVGFSEPHSSVPNCHQTLLPGCPGDPISVKDTTPTQTHRLECKDASGLVLLSPPQPARTVSILGGKSSLETCHQQETSPPTTLAWGGEGGSRKTMSFPPLSLQVQGLCSLPSEPSSLTRQRRPLGKGCAFGHSTHQSLHEYLFVTIDVSPSPTSLYPRNSK